MLPVDMGGSGGADLRRGMDALATFKKRVDAVLSNFGSSPGSSAKVEAHRLSAASFCGTGRFDEATSLHKEYERVHERLTSLSKSLGLQMEALQIAVHAADVGFDNLEEDLRRRFWEIRTEVNKGQTAPQRDQKLSDDKQAGVGY